MYFLIIISLIGFIYLFNKFLFINKNLTFEDKNKYNKKLKYINIYYNNNIFSTKQYTISKNNEININDQFDYIIINYLLDNKQFKLIEKNKIFKLPLYYKNDINKYVFINKILKIILYDNNLEVNITHQLLNYIGPNYDFNYSYINKINNNNCIIYVKDYLNILNIIYNNNTIIKIYDCFNNIHKYNINSILKWNPVIH